MVMFCRYWLAVETQPVPYGMLSQDSCCKVFMVIRPMWWGGEGHLSIAKSIYPKFSDILNLHSFSRHVTPYHFSLHLQWYWQGEFVWNLVTSSLDRNPINLRCACGTCAETVKKNTLDCTREPPCWTLDSLCTSCVLLSVAVPFCSVTVRSLWLSIRRLKLINSVLWFTHNSPYCLPYNLCDLI